MHFTISLTVSEGKRLIARGVAQDHRVVTAMNSGRVVITPGTTNGYVVEELMQSWPDRKWEPAIAKPFDKLSFVAGRTLPKPYDGPKITNSIPAIFIDGDAVSTTTSREAAEALEPGDVFIKGVNAINYLRRQAGVLIGHPKGGNVDEAMGPVVARRVCFLHPVGLEKNTGSDLEAIADLINQDPEGKGPVLWTVPGPLFTEIEALSTLAGVRAVMSSAGGVGGAEGAVWLSIFGDNNKLDKAQEVLDSVSGEPPFVGSDS